MSILRAGLARVRGAIRKKQLGYLDEEIKEHVEPAYGGLPAARTSGA